MLGVRRLALSGTLVTALAACVLVVAPMQDATAATATTNGSISSYARQYDTWRMKGNLQPVTVKALVGPTWDTSWGESWYVASSDSWAIGLRNRSQSQFTRIERSGVRGEGTFPNTSGTPAIEFAVNTRAVGGRPIQTPDAVAQLKAEFVF